MLNLLIKLFVKNADDVTNPKVRGAYGTLCSIYGIFLNLILFAVKYLAGILAKSVAITADAFNNLSDAGSSVITLLGFAISGKKPDPDHPFGHGRFEYLAGLLLSALIMLMGFELGKSSVEKIIHPEAIEAGIIPAVILVCSILVKVYMSYYNKRVGKKINSAAMQATATDSLSDSISTAVVLLSMVISWIFKINIDGWAGLCVAVFICFAGLSAMKDTVSPLLGQSPDKEFVDDIEKTVMAHEDILGIHDLIVHDYGPGRVIISLHAEVDGHGNVFELHDVIDNVEVELKKKYNCLATIHLDPIDSANKELTDLRKDISSKAKELIGPSVTIHDLRVVPGTTHTNIIFDMVLPADIKMSGEEASKLIQSYVLEKYPNHYTVINIDNSYV